jgi:WD40 repeat protein
MLLQPLIYMKKQTYYLSCSALTPPPPPVLCRIWDMDSRRCTAMLTGHTDRVVCVALSPDGTTVASASYDDTVRWVCANSLSRNGLFRTDRLHINSVYDLNKNAVLCCGDLTKKPPLVPTTSDVPVRTKSHIHRLWSLQSGIWSHKATLKGHANDVNSVAFSPDGTCLVTGSCDGTVK